nr:hypothetical protein CFP56_28107 [Quercus suber]
MKDRPRSSYGVVYVPPHHRLRFVINTPNYTSYATTTTTAATASSGAEARAADIVDSKLREPPQTPVISPRQTHSPYSQQEQLHNKISHFNSPRPPPPCDDSVSEEGSDRELDSFPLPLDLKKDDLGFVGLMFIKPIKDSKGTVVFWAMTYLRKNMNNSKEVRNNMNSYGKNTKNMTKA